MQGLKDAGIKDAGIKDAGVERCKIGVTGIADYIKR
jgi:hypothetical protein